uniref:I/LWEQ domain-containing protein n=1 Tax=Panagrolaimus davidi TaxID=227884 RepID=A0A914P8J3_9BILA
MTSTPGHRLRLRLRSRLLDSGVGVATTLSAVQLLVKAASEAQRELVSQGRLDARPQLSTDDFQWSERLISAVRTVAASVHQLCEAANGLVQGHGIEEKLISAAKHVASSASHLLVACKVKPDTNSTAKKRLQSAGHAVKAATEHLVATARQAVPQNDQTRVISQQMVSSVAQVMYAQFRDENVFLKDIKKGLDEVASNRTMESSIVIFPHGLIEGETTLIANHWFLGFRGGVQVHVYDKDKNLLWESSWRIFGVNMRSTSTRRWDHMIPEEFLSKIKSVSIIHKHENEIN